MVWTLAWILPLQGAIFLALGLYRGLWRFASMLDLQRIVLAAGLGAILIPLVLVMLKLQAVVPRSVLFFYPIVLIFLMAGDPLRVSDLEGASALQPARRARRAGAGRRRRRGRRAADTRNGAQPAMARRRAARRRREQAGPAAAQRQRAGPDRGPPDMGATIRRAQGHHRAALGQSRGAPARRRALRRQRTSRR